MIYCLAYGFQHNSKYDVRGSTPSPAFLSTICLLIAQVGSEGKGEGRGGGVEEGVALPYSA